MSATETTAARPLAAPFTDGLRKGVLRYQQCMACGGAQTLARYACQHCGERGALNWRDAAGAATVWAFTEVVRTPSDEFRALAPYTLAASPAGPGQSDSTQTPSARISVCCGNRRW